MTLKTRFFIAGSLLWGFELILVPLALYGNLTWCWGITFPLGAVVGSLMGYVMSHKYMV